MYIKKGEATMLKALNIPNVRTDRLYHITANWETNTQKRLTRDFLICATNKKDAETIARNHIPKKFATAKENIATDIQIRVRDLGISQKNRTYLISPIIDTTRTNPNEPSVLEYTATYFAYLFGIETESLSKLDNPSDIQKQRLMSMNQVADKTVLYLKWATEFLYEKDVDRNVFFQNKLNALTQTENPTPITDTTSPLQQSNPNASDVLLQQAKIQANIIIQNAKETAEIIINNAKETAKLIITNKPASTTITDDEKPIVNDEPNIDITDNTDTNNTTTEEPVLEHITESKTETSKSMPESNSDTNNIITESNTTDTTENTAESIDTQLEQNMQQGIIWLDTFLQTDNQLQIQATDIYQSLDEQPNVEMITTLENTVFNFTTTITPKDYFVNEIVNHTELETTARQATKMAIYHSIQVTDEDTLFQLFVKNYVQSKLKEMHSIKTEQETGQETEQIETISPNNIPENTESDEDSNPTWSDEDDDDYDDYDDDSDEPCYEDDPTE